MYTPREKQVKTMPNKNSFSGRGFSRRQFLEAAAALGLTGGLNFATFTAAPQQPSDGITLAFTNGRIHTMDAANSVVSQLVIRNGRILAVGNNVAAQSGAGRTIDLMGKTVIPGIIDAHDHVVLVGNRPGWHTPLEHVFTISDAIAVMKARSAEVPPNEFITTVGPISAMQFSERRLPNLTELDAVGRPVFITAAQGGTRTNTLGKMWFETRGVTVGADGTIGNPASGLALQTLRKELLTPESRKRNAANVLQYYAQLGITTHRDAGAFHSDGPSTGVANENTYTMHDPFLALNREGKMPARLRIEFLHQDSPTANPPLPTLSQRLRNSFPMFGNDWLKTDGIGEFTGGGVDGLRAIAKAGWRAEDHALNLAGVTGLIRDRETVNAEIPISNLRWIIAHIPDFPMDLANRANAMGVGVLVGWGALRTGMNVGPPYRMLMNHPIKKGYHSDGGDITVINPWLNLYTITTGKNLAGQQILGDQNLTREETLRLATSLNKWFIWDDELGSIEPGNHADIVVLDRDYFTILEEEII